MKNIIPQTMDRRSFLRALGGATLFASLPKPLHAMQDDLLTVSIFHTTDLHGNILPTSTYEGIPNVGGLARCATQIHLWKRLNPHHILIDAGDVYQGTAVGLQTEGRVMIDAFNHLNYDAWVIGNHEFDWGMDAVNGALTRSAMPVLCANSLLDGQAAGTLKDAGNPLSRVAPYIIKEIEGIRVGVIGVTTPGMPYWFHESLYKGFAFLDPVEPVRKALKAMRARKVNAVVLAGHMGIRRAGDDFANRTETLIKEFPEIAAFIGGHTHQNEPNINVNGTPFTQSNYFGIHMGRLDLTFSRDNGKLKWVQPMTSYMDDRFAIDPAILSIAEKDIAAAHDVMSTPVGTLAETLDIDTDVARPSQVEELIAAALIEAMKGRNIDVDGVVHGLLFPDGPFTAGNKTIGDLWSIMPYENLVVTARLNREEIITILHEVYGDWSKRNIMGMYVEVAGRGRQLEIREVYDREGRPLHARNRYTIAFNSFDAQSGGQRYLKLREILRRPNSGMTIHPVQTRDAIIDYFTAREVVHPIRPLAPVSAT